MALTEKNQLLIAFKKLYGKSHTSAKFGIFNESIATSVQLATSTLFGSTIPSIPSTGSYSITSGSVERVTFNLASISLSTYTNTLGSLAGTTIDDEGDTAVNGIHAYKLVLPNNYTSLSSNTKKGTGVFLNSATASDSNGGLQLIPPSLGDLYSAEVSSSSGIIGGLDAEDYYLDYYSGILFVQDIARTPTSVTAYLYVGDYGVVNSISSSFATNALTASYALTAAYAENAGGALTFVSSSGNITGSGTAADNIRLKDDITITSVTASFKGNLAGTASFATSASHALTASYAANANIDTGSFATTGSNVFKSSQTISGSLIVTNGITGRLYDTASYALTAAYAENISNITNAYNSLREIVTGTFDANGTKLIELQKFLNTDIDYITLDITTKPSGTSYYTNDLISFYMSGNLTNKLEIQLSAPAYGTNDRYKIIAVKETGSF